VGRAAGIARLLAERGGGGGREREEEKMTPTKIIRGEKLAG